MSRLLLKNCGKTSGVKKIVCMCAAELWKSVVSFCGIMEAIHTSLALIKRYTLKPVILSNLTADAVRLNPPNSWSYRAPVFQTNLIPLEHIFLSPVSMSRKAIAFAFQFITPKKEALSTPSSLTALLLVF